MRGLFLSDIHLDINSREVGRDLLPDLIQYVHSQAADFVVIVGDISDNYKSTINVLNRLEQETGVKILFVPGNHDIWMDKGQSSWKAYRAFEKHSSSLIGKPYHINDEYVVVGDMGWYDYSFGPETIHRDMFEQRKKKLWKDAFYAHWGRTDEQMMKYMLDKWKEQLDKCTDKKVIFVNHFVPFYDFITTSYSDDDWNVQNGYIGSREIGKLIQEYANIEWVVFGHTHRKYGVIENYKGYNFICNPIGFPYEWKNETFAKELMSCGTLLEI